MAAVGYTSRMRKLTHVALLGVGLLCACSRDLELPAEPGAVAPLAVEPPFTAVAPRATVSFTISGGTPPYEVRSLFALEGSTVEAAEAGATYTAGPAGGGQDELLVTDAAGAEVRARIQVGARVSVQPAYAYVNAGGRLELRAGGGQPPYRFTFDPPGQDGDGFFATTFTGYEAGAETDGHVPLRAASDYANDRVRIEDATGDFVYAIVSVGPGLSILASATSLSRGQTVTLQGLGGSPPHTFEVEWPGGAPLAGVEFTAEGSTARLTVPAGAAVPEDVRGDVLVRLRDAGEGAFTEELTIPVEILAIEPLTVRVPPRMSPGAEITLSPSGGLAPYAFRFTRLGNLSGGTLSADGVYRAGPNPHQEDVIRVEDAAGNAVELRIPIGATTLSAAEAGRVDESLREAYQPQALQAGHAFLGTAHVVVEPEGGLASRPALRGRVPPVVGLDGHRLPDVLHTSEPELDGAIYAYTGTVAGDLSWAGGGAHAAAAIVVVGERSDQVVLGTSPDCALRSVELGAFLRNEAPPACAVAAAEAYRWLVRAGPAGHVGAAASDRVAFFEIADGQQPQLAGECLVPGAGAAGAGPPVAVDLDQDGAADVVHVLSYDGPGGRTYEVTACLFRAPPLAPERLTATSPLVSFDTQVFAGPTVDGGGTFFLDPRASEGRRLTELWGYAGIIPTLGPLNAPGIPPLGALLATGDADGDLQTDVLELGDFGDVVLHYGSPGTLDAPDRFRLGPQGSYDLAVARLNGDGCEDLLAVVPGNARLLGGGHPRCSDPGAGVEGPFSLAFLAETGPLDIFAVGDAADYDADGRIDLLAMSTSFEPSILPFDGDTNEFGTPIRPEITLPPLFARPFSARLQAPLPDGRWPVDPVMPEVDPLTGGVPRLYAYLIDPDDPARPTQHVVALDPPAPRSELEAADADGDGIVDVVAWPDCPPGGCTGVEPVLLYRGEGQGEAFSLAPAVVLTTLSSVTPAVVVDPERRRVVIVSPAPGMLCMRTVDVPTGVSSPETCADPLGVPDAGGGRVTLRDLDADGLPEIVLLLRPSDPGAGFEANGVLFATVEADGTVGTFHRQALAPPSVTFELRLLDVDGDGRPELLTRSVPVDGNAPPDVRVLLNELRPPGAADRGLFVPQPPR